MTTLSDSEPVAKNHVEFGLPATIGAFRLEREIGRGSSGTVYRGVNLETGATVAVKLLHDPRPEQVASFKAETRRVADVMHSNLLVPQELVSAGGRWFFSMDLIDGLDLVRHVRSAEDEEGLLSRLKSAFSQLISAVAALHHAGLVHLDLKPANVLVDANGQVFVLDFGLARQLTEAARTWSAGTPGYWAPEQARGMRGLPASDCYAIGVMLHEALLGVRPGDVDEGLLPVPSWLAQVFRPLLAHAPEERPTIEELGRVFARSDDVPRQQSGGAAFVGRGKELASLHEHLRAAREERARLVVLRGPSGIGKTALLAQFLREVTADSPDAFSLVGRCYERETVPYKGVDVVVDSLATMLEQLPKPVRRALIAPGVESAAEIFPRLRDVLGSMTSVLDDPLAVRTRSLQAMRTLIERIARHSSVVLCIDDTQWADRDTGRLFVEILRGFSQPGLLVVWTCRTETGPFFNEWQRREFQFLSHGIDLNGLEQQDALTLASQLLGKEKDRAPAVVREAAGNPFLLEQLAFHAGVSASGGDLLTLLVRDRLRRVSEPARVMAILAALAGRPLLQSVLFRALPDVSPTDASRALLELRRHALIHAHGLRLDDQVETWHDRIAQVMLQTATPEESTRAHERLAEALEATGSSVPAELAHHYASAGQALRALPYYRAAGEEAYRAMAFERAAQYYAAAAATAGLTREERGRLDLATAEALFNAGRSAEAAARFGGVMHADTHEDRENLALRASEAWLLSGHVDAGMATLSPVLAARRAPMRRGISAAWAIFCQLLWLIAFGERAMKRGTRGRAASTSPDFAFEADVSWSAAKGLIYVSPVEGTDFLLRSLRAAILGQNRPKIARALGFLGAGMFMQFSPLERKGKRYLSLAGDMASALEDPYLQAMHEVWRGFGEVYPGHWGLMLEYSQRGLEILKQRCVGVAWESVIAQGVCAWAHQFLGDLRKSAEFALEGVRVAAQRGDLFAELMFTHYLAYAELGSSDVDGVRRRIADIDGRWRPGRYTAQHFYSTYLLAMADLCEELPESAADKLRACRSAFLRAGGARAPMSRIDFALLEARISLSLPSTEAKRRGLRSLEKIARQMKSERRADGLGHAAFVRAAFALQQGHTELAKRQWRNAATEYEKSSMALHAACAAWRLAELEGDHRAQAGLAERIAQLGIAQPVRWMTAFMPSGRRSSAVGTTGQAKVRL